MSRSAQPAAAVRPRPESPPVGDSDLQRRRGPVRAAVETMRPRQWTKNAFVLAGVVFSGRLTDPSAALAAVAAFAAFCLASGATYLVNDAADAETDRLNPRTARRPIPCGDLAPGTALAVGALAAVAAIALAAATSLAAAGVVAAFLALQLTYSFGLKHVLFVDVMIIAVGFVLRAYGGALAVDVRVSEWLLLCTGLLALFLGLTKRRGEAVAIGGERNPQRPVLDFYSVGLLDELISVVTPSIFVSYALYTVLGARSSAMLLTVPFVLYGIFRVLFLIHHHGSETEEPDVIVYRDRPLLLCVAGWGACAAVISALSA